MFQRFDTVKYVGSTLSSEIGNKIGEVVQKIPTGGYVVEFGNDAYIIDDSNLMKHSHADTGPAVMRRRKSEDEE